MTTHRGKDNRVALAAVIVAGVLIAVVADDRARVLLGNTAMLVAGVLAISLPVGVALAVLIVKTDLIGRRGLAVILGVLLLAPVYLQAAAWEAGFGLSGWYTWIVGMAPDGGPWLAGWRAAIWVHAMAAVPWVAAITGVGLWTVERELEEEALLTGTPLRVAMRVTLPRAAPAIAVAALWVAVTTAADMTVTDLFRIRTFAEEVYTSYNIGGWLDAPPIDLWAGVAGTGLLLAAGIILCRHLLPLVRQGTLTPRLRFRLGPWQPAAITAVAVVGFLLVGVPLANLVYKAGASAETISGGVERHWSAMQTLAMTAGSAARHHDEIFWSLTIAVCAAAAAIVFSLALAWSAVRSKLAAGFTVAVVATGLAVPGPALGMAIIWLLNRPYPPAVFLYDRTIAAPWIAQTIKATPLATLILWHAFSTIARDTLDSAASEGAGRWGLLSRIAIPARLPAIAAAWLVALIIAMGELPATLLVLPPGATTLPVRIFQLLHIGVDDRLAGLCLSLITVWTAAGLALLMVAKWATSRRS